jgi:hypothetical protein
MGGDPSLVRTVTPLMIRFCYTHHQGRESIHSKDLRVVFLTDKQANGPCQFERRNTKAKDGWEVVGAEDDFTFKSRENPAADEEYTDGYDFD